jgi:hypothetical protein
VADRTDHPDWTRWHAEYDVAGSRLERRLAVVRELLDEALLKTRPGPVRLVSACAGEGRDVLGVLPGHPRSPDVTAVLVEADPHIAARAGEQARASGLRSVSVLTADAGEAGSYQSIAPVNIALFCGVFGNITASDVARTILELRTLLAPGARVLWTRGRDRSEDPTPRIRRWLASAGFVEEAFVAPEDEAYLRGESSFTAGMNRLEAEPLAFDPKSKLFEFIGYRQVRRQEGS